MKQVAYLVIRSDKTMRVAKRPRIANDEVAIRVNLVFPATWGTIIGDVTIEVPDFAPAVNVDGFVPREPTTQKVGGPTDA